MCIEPLPEAAQKPAPVTAVHAPVSHLVEKRAGGEKAASGHEGERARGGGSRRARQEDARQAQAQNEAPPSTRDSLCSNRIDSFSSARAKGIRASPPPVQQASALPVRGRNRPASQPCDGGGGLRPLAVGSPTPTSPLFSPTPPPALLRLFSFSLPSPTPTACASRLAASQLSAAS